MNIDQVSSFLRAVLPENGLYCGASASPPPYKGYRHAVFDSVEALARFGELQDTMHHKDAYFETGSIKERLSVGTRKTENIAAFRCFYCDIDIAKKPTDYPSIPEASTALIQLCKTLRLPKPYIVSSGYGIHAYWPMEDQIRADEWRTHAARLKAVMNALNFRMDQSKVCDVTSVLRIPGTGNYKGERKPVEIKLEGVVTPTATLLSIIDAAYETHVPADQKKAANKKKFTLFDAPGSSPKTVDDVITQIMDNAAMVYDNVPGDPRRVFNGCKQLQFCHKNRGNVPYQLWLNSVWLCQYLETGQPLAHFISTGHPTYSVAETDLKFNEKTYGPITCDKFEDSNPGGCSKCVNKGKVRSPLVLGRKVDAAEEGQTVQVETVVDGETIKEEIELPELPNPFFRTVKNQIAMRMDAEAAAIEGVASARKKVIYEYELFPIRRWRDETTKKEMVTWRTFLPMDGWFTFNLDPALVYDKRALSYEVAQKGILPNIGHMRAVCEYMGVSMQHLQRKEAAQVMYSQMGWRKEETQFVLGNRVITETGIHPCEIDKDIDAAKRGYTVRGSLDKWKQAINIYNVPGKETHAFAVLASIATPLLSFTNLLGMNLSLVGGTGAGKTTAMRFANSFWGDPEKLLVTTNTTALSLDSRIAAANTLPVMVDEISNLVQKDPMEVSRLMYAVSEGQSRGRLTQTGAQRQVKRWRTIMMTTSNHSVMGALSLAKGNASAEMARVFEYRVPQNPNSKAEKPIIDEALRIVEDNHGMAGELYMKYIIDNRAEIAMRVAQKQTQIDREFGAQSQERYWSALWAIVEVAGEIVKEMGLLEYDMASIKDWFVKNMGILREVVQDEVARSSETLAQYLHENVRGILVTTKGDGRSVIPPKVEVSPMASMVAQSIPAEGTILLNQQPFRAYCAQKGLDFKEIEHNLRDRGILVGTGRRCIGSGTNFATAQLYVWIINSGHDEMAGVASLEMVRNEVVKAKGVK